MTISRKDAGPSPFQLAREEGRRDAFENRYPSTSLRRTIPTTMLVQQQQIDAIDQEIAALRARRQALLQVTAAPWPKRLPLYAQIGGTHIWDIGEQILLTGEALRRFVHFAEVRLDVEVAEDGSVTVLACDGQQLERRTL